MEMGRDGEADKIIKISKVSIVTSLSATILRLDCIYSFLKSKDSEDLSYFWRVVDGCVEIVKQKNTLRIGL